MAMHDNDLKHGQEAEQADVASLKNAHLLNGKKVTGHGFLFLFLACVCYSRSATVLICILPVPFLGPGSPPPS